MSAPVVIVLDIGKTNVKLLAATAEGEPLEQISHPNHFQRREPYLSIGADHILEWMLDALPALARRHDVGALIACTHGCAGQLCGPKGPALPMMDYEAVPPADVDQAYALVAPPYDEVFTTIGSGAMRIAKQLLWLETHHAQAFAKAECFLPFPQYLAWRLGGRRASELTMIAAQNQLWAPFKGDFSSLVDARGWRKLFPPFARAGEALGPVSPGIARRCGLPPATQVLCGVHDSNANLFRYKAAGLESRAILSTGTWMIGFERMRRLAPDDRNLNMAANVDVDGAPVASSLAMTGREYAVLAGEGECSDAQALAEIPALIAQGAMALPSFGPDSGLFPGSAQKGRLIGPAPANVAQRRALAALYAAMTAHASLDALGSRGAVVIDGGFAGNLCFARLLAALRSPQTVSVSRSSDGAALGAALLWRKAQRREPVDSVALETAAPFQAPGLDNYAREWRRLAAGAPLGEARHLGIDSLNPTP